MKQPACNKLLNVHMYFTCFTPAKFPANSNLNRPFDFTSQAILNKIVLALVAREPHLNLAALVELAVLSAYLE